MALLGAQTCFEIALFTSGPVSALLLVPSQRQKKLFFLPSVILQAQLQGRTKRSRFTETGLGSSSPIHRQCAPQLFSVKTWFTFLTHATKLVPMKQKHIPTFDVQIWSKRCVFYVGSTYHPQKVAPDLTYSCCLWDRRPSVLSWVPFCNFRSVACGEVAESFPGRDDSSEIAITNKINGDVFRNFLFVFPLVNGNRFSCFPFKPNAKRETHLVCLGLFFGNLRSNKCFATTSKASCWGQRVGAL